MCIAVVGECFGVIPCAVYCDGCLLDFPSKVVFLRFGGSNASYDKYAVICIYKRYDRLCSIATCISRVRGIACYVNERKQFGSNTCCKGYGLRIAGVSKCFGIVPCRSIDGNLQLANAELNLIVNTGDNNLVVIRTSGDSNDCTVVSYVLGELTSSKLFIRSICKSYLIDVVDAKSIVNKIKSRRLILTVINQILVINPVYICNSYNSLCNTPFLFGKCLVSTGRILGNDVVIVYTCAGKECISRIVYSSGCNKISCCCISCACVGKNNCKSYIFGKVGYFYALNTAVVNK